MNVLYYLFFAMTLLLFSCTQVDSTGETKVREKGTKSEIKGGEEQVEVSKVKTVETLQLRESKGHIDPSGETIETRFQVPANFKRVSVEQGSFAQFLRRQKLKPHETEVLYFNGAVKTNKNVYDAVLDLDIGNKDLHQCADAVMRLKAEYHWYNKEYDQIHFNFTNGYKVNYTEWMKGRRMIIKGNQTKWNNRHQPSNTYKDFWAYMELIFTYAGTLSLAKELQTVDYKTMQIGDVLIQGGSPGHAVIVLDMAISETTGERLYLLGQSYMPAQEIQVLKNNNSPALSPWYLLDDGELIQTPEWDFYRKDLKRF